MTDLIWVISSCVLIAAVIAVRAIFGKKMSAGLRYALWGLVLLRLLVPGTVFKSPVSVESAMQGSETVQNIEAVKDVSSIAMSENGVVIGRLRRPSSPAAAPQPGEPANEAANAGSASTAVVLSETSPERFERMQKTLAARDIFNIIWYTGMALAAAYFIAANLRFYFRLRARRQRIETDAGCPVYSVQALNSSCLFLNSIYISKENAEDPQKLEYVLAHEKAHRRHGDGILALLRSAAIVLHWYNPLVWIAAFLSRRDSECFADSGALKELGDSSRKEYGKTLIELSSNQAVYAPIACAATMMTSGKRELKGRITNIARRKKMGAAICAIVLVLAFVSVGFTFLGGSNANAESGKAQEQTADNETEPNATAAPDQQTAEPVVQTEEPTAEPTEAPTPEPTEAAPQVDAHEYQLLRDFFEQKDAEGVTNGAKCFPDYDPDDISTWYDGSYEYYNYVGWNDDGHVTVLNIWGKGETPIVLCGRLALNELPELESVFTWSAIFEEVDASDLPAAAAGLDGRISISTVSGDAVISGGYLDRIYLCSSTHVLCEMTGDADTILSELPSFKIDITVENGGFAGVNAYTSENSYVVKLAVVPVDGKVFMGWYDEDGNLFSGYEYIELFGEESGESPYGANAEFKLIARFN